MIVICLPWPEVKLSPNQRQHWSVTGKAKASYRFACEVVTLGNRTATVPDGPLSLSLVFCPPTKRSYDRDNLATRMKAGLDGMCDALGFDDSRFAVVTVRVIPSEGKPGRVIVTIVRDDGTQ